MIDKVLGQKVTYPQTYTPDVLVAVPRQLNRAGLGIADDALPFVGADAWHAYEVSCLTDGGLPCVALMKIVYPCTSPSIVESKSLKLYLNSFNMEKMGKTAAEAMSAMVKRVTDDLTALLETTVTVGTFACDEARQEPFGPETFETLEAMPWATGFTTDTYTEAPQMLTAAPCGGRMMIKSHLLRSNCRVTHQPDWGTVFIHMEGDALPDKESLLKYIVSLRGENHFHEEICELIYHRLRQTFSPRDLMVCCIYTRRGGIDICPVRASRAEIIPNGICSANNLTKKLIRQ